MRTLLFPVWVASASFLGKRSHRDEDNEPAMKRLAITAADATESRRKIVDLLADNPESSFSDLLAEVRDSMNGDQLTALYHELMAATQVPNGAMMLLWNAIGSSFQLESTTLSLQRLGFLQGLPLEQAVTIVQAWRQFCVDPLRVWPYLATQPCVKQGDTWVMNAVQKSLYFRWLLELDTSH